MTETNGSTAVSTNGASTEKGKASDLATVGVENSKGKGKRTAAEAEIEEEHERKTREKAAREDEEDDEDVEEEDDDEDDDEVEADDDDDDEDAEDELEEMDPMAIRSRRTRGVKVDYTSPEALAKAGLKPGEAAGDDDE